MQQQRFNDGKPKLSYVFTNHNVIVKLFSSDLDEDVLAFPLDVDQIYIELSRFLARKDNEQDALIRAFVGTLQQLQLQLGGELPQGTDMSLLEYVVRCDKAWDEFCLVCERGAQKYEDGNYRFGETFRHYADSTLRHLRAFSRGDTINDDGCHTLANALWNEFMLLDQPEWRDDRLQALNEVEE